MAQFYFDVFDGARAVPDRHGIELQGLDEVADQAAALLPDLARDVLPCGQSHDFATLVRDGSGNVVYRAVLLFRGQWPEHGRAPYTVTVSDVRFNIARSRDLRREVRELRRQLCAGIDELFVTLELAAAAVRGGAAERRP